MAGEAPEDDEPDPLWVERPWAATLDLIASEYGWTDDQILDLTLARVRQIREVILARRDAEFRRNVTLEEVKVRHLVSATFAAANNKKGAAAGAAIELFQRDEDAKKSKVPTTARVSSVFKVDSNPQYGLIDTATIERRAAEIRAEKAAAEIREAAGL